MMRRKRMNEEPPSPIREVKQSHKRPLSFKSPEKNIDLSPDLEPGPKSIQDVFEKQNSFKSISSK